ncbi:MAG: hypothetical protein AEth_00523 [Candidatus Argoarchaeum ethanivorans]|uniref:Uncharacterized protein n=1 Tax=Candidatus Argoarchaeum ethanivorans TaxID=2608793 RepID=A0A8B6SDF9_9EURY|nr:MAG: hypothetical protein AEth_00523 [Candidatus Argoarchaeum ethanivorans]
MGLADRDYMRWDYNSSAKDESFESHTKEFDNGRFTCTGCGRSYSTKEAAMECFNTHYYEFKGFKDGRRSSSKASRHNKVKSSIKNTASKISKLLWSGVKHITLLCIIGLFAYAFFGSEYSNEIGIGGDFPYHRDYIPYSKASGSQICLINYNNATDPTWDELIVFLEKDDTDEELYLDNSFVCADFAEMLHNNAETSGIKTAWVGVDFTVGEGHALNAFNTTDKGLVYVDCTGEWFSPLVMADFNDLGNSVAAECDYDMIAYVSEGREYGLISIEKATSPEYSFYETYTNRWAEFDRKLDAYNSDVEAYDNALNGRTTISNSTEYAKLNKMYNDLEIQSTALEQLEKELGMCWWEPLGIVADIEVCW